jgi:hypothetical protein
MWHDIEAGLQARESGKSGVLGDSISRLSIGEQIKVSAALGHVAECERDAPRASGPPFGPRH